MALSPITSTSASYPRPSTQGGRASGPTALPAEDVQALAATLGGAALDPTGTATLLGSLGAAPPAGLAGFSPDLLEPSVTLALQAYQVQQSGLSLPAPDATKTTATDPVSVQAAVQAAQQASFQSTLNLLG